MILRQHAEGRSGGIHDTSPALGVLRWQTYGHYLCIACHTFSGVKGISRAVTPSGARASSTALAMAAGAATLPASPAPFTPRTLSGLGVSVSVSSKTGTVEASGTA